jgi:hypothetical protein
MINDLKNWILLTDFGDHLFYFNLLDYKNYKNKERDLVQTQKQEVEDETKEREDKPHEIKEEESKKQNGEIATYCLFRTNITMMKISCAPTKVLIIDKDYSFHLIYENELAKNKSLTYISKSTISFKSKNTVDFSCGEHHWLFLEREDVTSIENWDSTQVMDWFSSLGLGEFVNIIKYEKISGKDILKEDHSFFEKVLGMPNDIYQKVRYEINNVKNPYAKTIKLWGGGSNKQGQLGLFPNNNFKDNFYKNHVSIPLPQLQNEYDYFSKVFCGKTFSLLLSQFGEIFITGIFEFLFRKL